MLEGKVGASQIAEWKFLPLSSPSNARTTLKSHTDRDLYEEVVWTIGNELFRDLLVKGKGKLQLGGLGEMIDLSMVCPVGGKSLHPPAFREG